MKIDKVVVGSLQENCYIVTKNNKTLIIDPGDEASKIIKEIDNLNVVGILITHYHFDHIGALEDIKNYFNIDVIKDDDCEIKKIFNYEVILTPGHTSDSKTYYFKDEKKMFVGDFIFKNSIGRWDLPTGDINDMQNSLNLISKYDNDIIIYPGHGDETTLGKEKNNFKYYFN